MSLAEVMVAMFILAILCVGFLGGIIQSRRLTDGSVCQNSAQAAVQSYIEQLKNMPIASLLTNPIPTEIDDATKDWLTPSTGTPPNLSTLTPGGTAPTGAVDNLKDIPADPTRRGAQTTWAKVWPNASTSTLAVNAPNSVTPYWNDTHVNIWVWVTDLTSVYTTSSEKCYGITFIYTWSFWDGYKFNYYMGSTRTAHAAVPTYN